MENSRILLILYYYAPLISPRVFRWQAVAEEFVRLGFPVDVVCCAYHNLPRDETIGGVNIYRIKPWFFKTVYRKNIYRLENLLKIDDLNHEDIDPLVPVLESSVQEDHYLKPNSQPRRLPIWKGIFPALFSRIYHYLWWPDFGMFWILPAYKKALELMQDRPYKKIFAISWPVNAHVVGCLLSKKINRIESSLILDIGDPFSTNELNPPNNFVLYKSVNKRFEQALCRRVDGISVTTPQTKYLYINTFDLEEKKVLVIPPAYNNSFILPRNIQIPDRRKDKIIRAVYIGSLRKSNHPPDMLLRLFKDMSESEIESKIELHLIGDINDCEEIIDEYRNYLPLILFTHGLLPHDKALQATYEADVLINIGLKSEYQVPSKLVDYIASGNPIINLQLISNDSSVKVLNQYPAFCNLDLSCEEYNVNLQKLLNFLSTLPDKVPQETINRILKDNSIQEISKLYLSSWWK